MITVDQRTRRDDEITPVDAGALLRATSCPSACVADGWLAEPGARELAPRPLAIEVDGRQLDPGARRRRRRRAAGRRRRDGARVRLDDEQLTDLVHDVRTPMGFLTGGDLAAGAGPPRRLPRLVGRAPLAARPAAGAHRAARSTSATATARRSTSHRGFGPDDDPEEHGPLPRRGRLPPPHRRVHRGRDGHGVGRHGRRLPALRARTTAARGGPPRASGEHRAVRLQHFHEHSPTTAVAARRTTASPGIAGLTTDGHRPEASVRRQRGRGAGEAARRGRGHLRPAVAQGLQPRPPLLPLLLDDRRHLGHRRRRRTPGQLRVVAGSHRALDPARVRARAASTSPRSTCPRRPATSPCTSAARCT